MKAIIASFCFLSAAACATPRVDSSAPSGAPRTVLLQLFEWPWAAVGEECETVLGPAGFAAVQVSPAQEHIVANGAPWWERYQPVSYQIASRSGSETEFAAMVKKCAAAGVDVYADVVLNHMNGVKGEGIGFAGTHFSHYQYGNLWSYSDFHHCGRNGDDGLRNFSDLFELQNCELLGMADLNTGAPAVQEKLAAYLNHLLDLGVKGFRIDAAKHISPADLNGLFARLSRPNYRVLELILSPGEPVSAREYQSLGGLNNFQYAYELGAVFRSGNLEALPGLAGKTGIGTDDAVVFVENHDLERRPGSETLLSLHVDPVLNRLGQIFLLTWPYGYPAVFSGYTFTNNDAGPPLDSRGLIAGPGSACAAPFTCAHRALWLRNLVGFRNATDGVFAATNVFANGPVIAFGRGALGHVVISVDSRARSLELPTQMAPGHYCNIAGEGCADVAADGMLKLTLPPKSAFVIRK
ncbi:MAG: alpha-amylase [Bdellovibrionota bacterium]